MRKALVVVLAGLGSLASACSSSSGTIVDQPPGSSGPAHVGDTLKLTGGGGRTFELTLTSVVDPARATTGRPGSGRRFVAVLLQFTNTSHQQLSGDSAVDADLVGSNGSTYTPAQASLRECGKYSTPYKAAVGQSATSCVAFEVRTSVRITEVQFSPAAGFAGDTGQWLVP